MNPKARQELIGIAALLVGLFVGLTLLPVGLTGSWGRTIGNALWQLFGVGAIVVPILGVGWALAAFDRLGALSWGRAATLGAGLVLLIPYGIAIGIRPTFPPDYANWTRTERLVGLLPGFLANGLESAIGTAGAVVGGLLALSAVGIFTVGWHPLALLRQKKGEGRREMDVAVPVKKQREPAERRDEPLPSPISRYPKAPKPKPVTPPKPAPPPPPGSLIPPIDLLTEGPGAVEDADAAQIEDMGRRLVATLETFRVGAQITHKTVGPVVTRFELEPGRGVKVGRVSALADDLALAMRAQSLRIVAPIPGKAAIGIEVPNPTPRLVHVRDMIDSAEFRRAARVGNGAPLPAAPRQPRPEHHRLQ